MGRLRGSPARTHAVLVRGGFAALMLTALLAGCSGNPEPGDVVTDTARPDVNDVQQDVVVDTPMDTTCVGMVCGGSCIDTQNDVHNCGACNMDCSTLPNTMPAAARCVMGRCQVAAACTSLHSDCNNDPADGCETDTLTVAHCGSCTTACAEPTPVCSMGAGSGGGPGCASGCMAPTGTRCNMTCVNTLTDRNNCGTCGHACTAGANAAPDCVNGVCVFSCNVGFHQCGGNCVSNMAPATCGSSCTACPVPANGTATCDGTACGIACNTGFHACGGACVSNTSVMACGSSCDPCPTRANSTPACDGTACGVTCDAGFADCDRDPTNGCEADLHTSAHCGSCTAVCMGSTPFCGQVGAGMFMCGNSCGGATPTLCGAICVNTQTDTSNCGACGTVCAGPPSGHGHGTCGTGRCSFVCDTGYHNCGGDCVSDTDVAHCGTTSCTPCPTIANSTATCSSGTCGIHCNAGFHNCGGVCESDTSLSGCGPTCSPCPTPLQSVPTCERDTCGFRCLSGYHQCGTQCYPNNSVNSCGTACDPCPVIANATPTCNTSGRCVYTCNPGYFDCRGMCIAVAASNCNDNNAIDGDGCSAACIREAGWNCTAGVPTTCTPICGDSIHVSAEQCDDGNMFSNDASHTTDGCTYPGCTVTPGFYCQPRMGLADLCLPNCGNGVRDGTEACDDGNRNANDGCTNCQIDTGYSCGSPVLFPSVCRAVCGDGYRATGTGAEVCDDANTRSGDGCAGDCHSFEGGIFSCFNRPFQGRTICSATLSGTGYPVGDYTTNDSTVSFGPAGCIIGSITTTHNWSVQHTYAYDILENLIHTPPVGAATSVQLIGNFADYSPPQNACGYSYYFDLIGPYTFSASGPSQWSGCSDPLASGSYYPDGSFSSFVGTNAQGNWTFRTQDRAGGDIGTVAGWSMTITCQ